jgi:hypothetical protein
MRISIRRLPNGELAFQRLVLRADAMASTANVLSAVRTEKAPHRERTFIDAILGEKGRAIVARINPRFRRPRLQVIKVHGDDH